MARTLLVLASVAIVVHSRLSPAVPAFADVLEDQTYACGAYGVSDYGSNTCVPAAPTLSNPAEFYDRLSFVLTPTDDGTDPSYAIAISNDGFATTRFISNNLTIVDELSISDWQTYADWGGAQGAVVTGLEAGSLYEIKVKAKQGQDDETAYSVPASASTAWPTLTFSVDGNGDMGTWSGENNYSSTAVSILTTSTNAYNGYRVHAFATQPLRRQNGNETIDHISGSYAAPISWTSGEGFGYTTNDPSIAGAPKWNQSPCPGDGGPPLCYAAFRETGPGDVVADHDGTQDTAPIYNEAFFLTLKAVSSATQAAGTYSTTIVYTVVPAY